MRADLAVAKRKELDVAKLIASILCLTFVLYWGVAAFVFEWRHEKANRLSLIKNIGSVLTFGTVKELQQ